jgi:hypothetical protein
LLLLALGLAALLQRIADAALDTTFNSINTYIIHELAGALDRADGQD